jgi:hypothetical protein
MTQSSKALEKARREQERFQGAAVQIAAIMRFADERHAESIIDEHDLANRALDWYSRLARTGPQPALCSIGLVSTRCHTLPSCQSTSFARSQRRW